MLVNRLNSNKCFQVPSSSVQGCLNYPEINSPIWCFDLKFFCFSCLIYRNKPLTLIMMCQSPGT